MRHGENYNLCKGDISSNNTVAHGDSGAGVEHIHPSKVVISRYYDGSLLREDAASINVYASSDRSSHGQFLLQVSSLSINTSLLFSASTIATPQSKFEE